MRLSIFILLLIFIQYSLGYPKKVESINEKNDVSNIVNESPKVESRNDDQQLTHENSPKLKIKRKTIDSDKSNSNAIDLDEVDVKLTKQNSSKKYMNAIRKITLNETGISKSKKQNLNSENFDNSDKALKTNMVKPSLPNNELKVENENLNKIPNKNFSDSVLNSKIVKYKIDNEGNSNVSIIKEGKKNIVETKSESVANQNIKLNNLTLVSDLVEEKTHIPKGAMTEYKKNIRSQYLAPNIHVTVDNKAEIQKLVDKKKELKNENENENNLNKTKIIQSTNVDTEKTKKGVKQDIITTKENVKKDGSEEDNLSKLNGKKSLGQDKKSGHKDNNEKVDDKKGSKTNATIEKVTKDATLVTEENKAEIQKPVNKKKESENENKNENIINTTKIIQPTNVDIEKTKKGVEQDIIGAKENVKKDRSEEDSLSKLNGKKSLGQDKKSGHENNNEKVDDEKVYETNATIEKVTKDATQENKAVVQKPLNNIHNNLSTFRSNKSKIKFKLEKQDIVEDKPALSDNAEKSKTNKDSMTNTSEDTDENENIKDNSKKIEKFGDNSKESMVNTEKESFNQRKFIKKPQDPNVINSILKSEKNSLNKTPPKDSDKIIENKETPTNDNYKTNKNTNKFPYQKKSELQLEDVKNDDKDTLPRHKINDPKPNVKNKQNFKSTFNERMINDDLEIVPKKESERLRFPNHKVLVKDMTSDSSFFSTKFFILLIVGLMVAILFYAGFQSRKRIIGYLLEGRRPSKNKNRQGSSNSDSKVSYAPLNQEEVDSKNFKYIY